MGDRTLKTSRGTPSLAESVFSTKLPYEMTAKELGDGILRLAEELKEMPVRKRMMGYMRMEKLLRHLRRRDV